MAYAGFLKREGNIRIIWGQEGNLGAGNLRIMKTKKFFSLRFSPFFCLGLDEDQKKSLHLDSSRFSAQIPKGGGMTQFCALFLGIYALLAPQREGHGTMTL